MVEFVPPKPKELERKTSMFLSTVIGVMFRFAESSSGVSKLVFGATKEYISTLEEKVKQYPTQWFNFYNFWEEGKKKNQKT